MMKLLAHWRPYLGWTKEPFTIITDHANLQYWKSPRNLNQCTARWHANLQEYDYKIKYIPRNTNIPADTLSRPSGANQGKEDNKDVALIPLERFANTAHTNADYNKDTKCNLIILYHDHPTAGHPGRDETIRRTQQEHNWIGMKQWTTDYIKGCTTCQQNKVQTHKRKTPLYKITTTKGALPFQQVAMDLITGLPMHKGYNAILTIVDHGCSRAAVFLPYSTSITGPGIACLYLES
jgi:hypothetical protein